MLRLKANKTSLYRLVSDYENLPPMRRTRFTKAPRQPDYCLEWQDAGGLWCKAYIAAGLSRVVLSIEKKEFCGPMVSRMVYGLTTEDLRARGMTEEYVTAAERRRAKRKG